MFPTDICEAGFLGFRALDGFRLVVLRFQVFLEGVQVEYN